MYTRQKHPVPLVTLGYPETIYIIEMNTGPYSTGLDQGPWPLLRPGPGALDKAYEADS